MASRPIHLWIQHRTYLQAILEDMESGRLMLKDRRTIEVYKHKLRDGIALWDKLIELSREDRLRTGAPH
jgi:hypothetical protein